MPQALDSADRKLLIAAGVLLLAVLIASSIVGPQEMTGSASFPSSYSPAWGGAKAAFLLLQQLGYRAERWERPSTDLSAVASVDDSSNEILVLSQPAQPPSEAERFALREFLERGGRLLATGAAAADFLPQAGGFEQSNDEVPIQHFAPSSPSPLAQGAPEITMAPPDRWQPTPSQQVVYGNDRTAAVITYAVGKGRVIWWAAATPLTNGNIRDSGNVALLLNSINPSHVPPADVRVLWDEYHHGVHGSLWSYFARTPLPWGVAQFGLVFAAILATYSRRSVPPRSQAVRSRLSSLEFIETMGDLYQSAHAGSAAVRIQYQRLRFLLTRQLALPANLGSAELARSAGQQMGWEQVPLQSTLARAERIMAIADSRSRRRTNSRLGRAADAEALSIVQELFDYCARIEPGRTEPLPNVRERSAG
jgi:hypothetical protein